MAYGCTKILKELMSFYNELKSWETLMNIVYNFDNFVVENERNDSKEMNKR